MFVKERYHIAGIDTGFSAIKAAATNKEPVAVPAIFADFKPVNFVMSPSVNSLECIVLAYEQERFFVGNAAHVHGAARQTLSFDYYTSLQGVAGSLYLALHLYGLPDYLRLRTVIGVPVAKYGTLQESYRRRLQGRHFLSLLNLEGVKRSDHCIDVIDVSVLPQPVGSFFNVALGNDGSLQNKAVTDWRVGVIDIGGHTVDIVRIDKMQYVEKASESYSDVGCYQIQKRLSAEIYATYQVEIRPERLPHIITDGKIKIRGQERDITGLRRKAAREVANIIVSRLKNIWPDAWEMDRIYITGGGAFLVGNGILEALDPDRSGQVEIVADPVMANVRGYVKVGQRLWGEWS
jgi:plasmid segregation protein ParM